MKKAKTAIYIPNMDADTFEKICQEKGLQFVYVEVPADPPEEETDCEKCRYYPPSSLDGKPCTQCDPSNPLMNCFSQKEDVL